MSALINPDVDKLAADIVRREGGYNKIAGDRGGATNHGVSLRFAQGLPITAGYSDMDLNRDGRVDDADIRLVTVDVAKTIFIEKFYRGFVEQLPAPIQPFMFDTNVNGGAGAVLQRCLNAMGFRVAEDGAVGPICIAAAKNAFAKVGAKFFINALVRTRVQRFRNIVASNPDQEKFLQGWINRANSFSMA